jgi:hypothetical protein
MPDQDRPESQKEERLLSIKSDPFLFDQRVGGSLTNPAIYKSSPRLPEN